MLKKLLSGGLLVAGTMAMAADDTTVTGKPFFQQRSQGEDLARRMVGEEFFLTRCDNDCFSGSISAVAEYTQSFNRKKLAQFLTFNGSDTMTFSEGADADVRPQYFLLNDGFAGTVQFRPKIENFIFDVNLRLNLDEWLCGLYFEIGLPINWTRWNLDLRETQSSTGTTMAAGQVAADATAAPFNSIIGAFTGVGTVGSVQGNMDFGVVQGRKSKTNVAELQFILGYNFWCSDCGHLGVDLRVYAPTGTRPNGHSFFEPVSGNGKHTVVGGGVSAHYVLWENDCDQSFSVWFEGEAHHYFKAKQHRTFDLVGNGPGSRYLTLKQFNADATEVTGLVRGPNVLTREVNSTFGVGGAAALSFVYQSCGFTGELGYEFWGRSHEKLKLRGDDIPAGTYGVQGCTAFNALNTASETKINGTDCSVVDATPVFITNASLDLVNAANPSAWSNKVFGHVSYAWDCCDYAPFIGIGGYGEFGNKNHALSQWAVWAKGGFAFN